MIIVVLQNSNSSPNAMNGKFFLVCLLFLSFLQKSQRVRSQSDTLLPLGERLQRSPRTLRDGGCPQIPSFGGEGKLLEPKTYNINQYPIL